MKIDQILFPVDFSEHSLAMNSEVEWVASHSNSFVTLLHVLEAPASSYGGCVVPLMDDEEFAAYAHAENQRLINYPLRLPENRIQRVCIEGNPAKRIAQWAQEQHVDLIAMGTHGYVPFWRLLLGSVAMKVLHTVECPVWTHPARTAATVYPNGGISRILCAIDKSEEAVPLLRFTRDLAAQFGATVRLVHCAPETRTTAARPFNGHSHRPLHGWVRDEIYGLQSEAGTNFPLVVAEHSTVRAITDIASDHLSDLIVIGRGKVQGTLGTMRTQTYEIIRTAPCPVISFALRREEREVPHVHSGETKVQAAV